MVLIHQITEENFLEERKKGELELQQKIASFEALKSISDPTEFQEQFSLKLRDPTLWAYAFLFDKQNNPLRMLPYQDRFINDRNRFVYVTASNQTGKTYAICVKALHHALNVPNASVMIISKSEQQSIMVLDEIRWMLKRARINFTERIGEVENRTELQLKGPDGSVSVLRCFPPTTSALGFPATLILADEINFWEKIGIMTPTEYYDQVLEPRTNMTKSWEHPFLTMGQICFISNPNGMQGIGWRTYSADPRFNCYRYCWLAYPANTLEEYKSHQARLPMFRFASIYAAEYVSPEGGFITPEQYEEFVRYNYPLVIPPGSLLYLGGDLAGEDVKSRERDFNTLYGVIQVENINAPMFPRIRVVYRHEWPSGTNRRVIYDEIRRLNSTDGISVAMFAYDKVGVGDSVKNDLIEQGILNETQIESLTYSLPNKSEVFLNAQTLFSLGMIEGRDISKLKEQLLSLEVTKPEGSVHLKIHHRTEGIHDDEVDALFNACWVAKRTGYYPSSFSFVSSEEKEIDLVECKHYELEEAPYGQLKCKTCGEVL